MPQPISTWNRHALAAVAALLLVCGPALIKASDGGGRNEVPVRVDERVELLSIVFRLADAFEYHLTPGSVPYARDVDAHFGPYKHHPAIRMASKLREERRIGFDKVAWFAVHITGNPQLKPKLPFDQMVDMERPWSAQSAADFLNALQRFADDSKAFTFMRAHQELYAKSADRLARKIAQRPYRAWLDGFFGGKPGAEFSAIVGMLNGSTNYGTKVRYPDGREEILPIVGAAQFDASGLPTFDASTTGTVAHEFCHSYCNPVVDRFADRLLPSAEKIFPRRKELLSEQIYTDARSMLYESLVRACTYQFLRAHGTSAEADAELQDQLRRGFYWNPELSSLLSEYEGSRDTYPTLVAFMPRIVKFFERQAASLDERLARLPRVAQFSPENGAKDVDPALTELRIKFNRPMKRDNAALFGRKEELPAMPSQGKFKDDAMTFIQPVKLEPGRTYRISVNTVWQPGFASAAGLPLDPIQFTFTTAKR
jgi:hypothetical protein